MFTYPKGILIFVLYEKLFQAQYWNKQIFRTLLILD
jgi:hypothetical protein